VEFFRNQKLSNSTITENIFVNFKTVSIMAFIIIF